MMTVAARMDCKEMLSSIGCAFERDVLLGPLTWYGVGGVAEAVAHPRDADELSRLVAACRSSEVPLRVLGKGANLLVCEGSIAGVIVRLDQLKEVQIDAASGAVRAGGGADLEQLITATVREGLEG